MGPLKSDRDSPVVDCDSHVMEPADLWTNYLEPRYRDRAIRIVEVDGQEQLVADGHVILPMGLAGLGGANVEPRSRLRSDTTLRYLDGCPPASYIPAERARLLDEWKVGAGVLFPTIGILPLPIEDQDLLSAYARAYNTWQAEFSSEIPGRTVSVAMLNLANIDEACRELDRCLALGFRGVFVPPEAIDGHRLGEAHFDPLWQRCADAGVPLCLHVVVRFGGPAVPWAQWHAVGVDSLFTFSLGAPGQLMPAVVSMVADGLFDRIPDLKLLCVEAGCGWAPFLMDRLDEKFEFFGDTMPVKLELQPSEYLRRNVWYVAEPEERTIDATLDLVGEDRVMWGSDFPHIDSSLEAATRIHRSLADLSPARRAAVLGGNAATLFGIAVPPAEPAQR